MPHQLFLFDLDDTLLDYTKSEQLSFALAMEEIGFRADLSDLFAQLQAINFELWRSFEAGVISRHHLKVERWRKTFLLNQLALDHERASHFYLESFTHTVSLVDGAEQVCEALSATGEVGVITNGVEDVQKRRLAASGLMRHISFVSTSEAAGFAKPDVRCFEHTARMAKPFNKSQAIMIGDRLEADIIGATAYGIESCWFNPGRLAKVSPAMPTYEVASLRDLLPLLKGPTTTGH
jgi:2-haloacid dehalogenase